MTPRPTASAARSTDKDVLKSVRFSAIEAELLSDSAQRHGMSVSDVIRAALVLWRESVGDRQGALDAWVKRLTHEHGPSAILTARVNESFSLDVDIAGEAIDEFMAEAVFDGRDQVQLWVGDPETDARAYLGRVRTVAGAAISVPLQSLPSMGASDVHAV